MIDGDFTAFAVTDEIRFSYAGVLVEYQVPKVRRISNVMMMVEVGPEVIEEEKSYGAGIVTL